MKNMNLAEMRLNPPKWDRTSRVILRYDSMFGGFAFTVEIERRLEVAARKRLTGNWVAATLGKAGKRAKRAADVVDTLRYRTAPGVSSLMS
jgi:hypothetical protein